MIAGVDFRLIKSKELHMHGSLHNALTLKHFISAWFALHSQIIMYRFSTLLSSSPGTAL